MNGISIILCCHNSAGRLGETLRHIAGQTIPEQVSVELVLVDNASTDATVELAKKEWSNYSTKIVLKVVHELRTGQIFARIRGVREALHEIIVFCDDDNWLMDSYLSVAWDGMSRFPKIGAMGGRGIPVSPIPLPEWFEENKTGYACGDQWQERGICTDKMHLWGAGLVARKSILDLVFDPGNPMLSTGRKEGAMLSGDDMEVCKRIILLGYDLFYEPALVYSHYISANRLTKEYLSDLNAGVLAAIPVQRFYSFQIVRERTPLILLPFILAWHSIQYLLFKSGFSVGKRKPIINMFKVISQGILKSGLFHDEYTKVAGFARFAKLSRNRQPITDNHHNKPQQPQPPQPTTDNRQPPQQPQQPQPPQPTTLFFEPHITGHRGEYVNHLIDYIQDNQPPGVFIFIVHPGFSLRRPMQSPSGNDKRTMIHIIAANRTIGTLNPFLRSLGFFRMADYYARLYGADRVCYLNFNDVQLALGFFRPRYLISGILFKPFTRNNLDSFRVWLTFQRKYLQTWLFIRNRNVKAIFLLNDSRKAAYFNQTFHTSIFRMLPDPVLKLTPEPGFDVRKHFGIFPERRIYLHIGSLLKRKGTLDILDAFRFLSDDEISKFTLILIGKADSIIDAQIRQKLLQIQASQPAASIKYRNEFISSPVFKSFIDQSDLVLVPYRYTESSSGIAGHAIAAGKPMLGVEKGLLGEMITDHGTGIFIDEVTPEKIADGIKRALITDFTGKSSDRFLELHAKEDFAKIIITAISL